MTVLLYVLGVVIFLFAIFGSIALHELGHLYYAKKFGCRVSQYMVGFGPTIWSRRYGETEYGIKLVPLGGYVKIIGMFPPETEHEKRAAAGEKVKKIADAAELTAAAEQAEKTDEPQTVALRKSNTGMFTQMISQTRAAEFELVEPGDSDRLFYKLPWTKKILVMLAGPGINIALAFVCFLGVYGIYGTHELEPTGSTVIGTVSDCVIPASSERTECTDDDKTSPASAAGLQEGDQVLAVNGHEVSTWDEMSARVKQTQDDSLSLLVLRDGQQTLLQTVQTVSVPNEDGTGTVGYLGVGQEYREVVTHHGPIYTMQHMGEMTAHAVSAVAELPGRVWNVAQAIVGNEQRAEDSPMSVIGGSRLAGEVAASQIQGLTMWDKAAMMGLVIGSFNLFIGVFNLIPLMPLDGGHIAGATWEGIRKSTAKLFRRPDPGYVNVARQLPLAYCLGLALVSAGVVLMIGDVVVPLSSGL